MNVNLLFSIAKQNSNLKNNEPMSLLKINASEHNSFPALGSSTMSASSIKGASKAYNLAVKKADLLKKKLINLKLKLNSVSKEHSMVFS